MLKPQKTSISPRGNIFKVVYIGLSFMMLFTAYTTAQNLTTLIYRQLGFEHLGEICIFTIYAFLAAGNLLASHFKHSFSVKKSLVYGSLTFSVFLLVGVLSTYCGNSKSDSLFCNSGIISL